MLLPVYTQTLKPSITLYNFILMGVTGVHRLLGRECSYFDSKSKHISKHTVQIIVTEYSLTDYRIFLYTVTKAEKLFCRWKHSLNAR